MKTITSLLAALFLAASAHARLGDTQAKVTERYGKPVQVYRDVKGRTGYIHRFDGYLIMVQYIDGISQSEVYARENDAELNDTELDAIHAANAQGGQWQKIPKPITTADGSVMRGMGYSPDARSQRLRAIRHQRQTVPARCICGHPRLRGTKQGIGRPTMTIRDFISSRELTRFDASPSGVRPHFAPACLFESFEISAPVEIYRDSSESLWVALAPTLKRFKLYRRDVLAFEGAIDTAYRELDGIKPDSKICNG
jgi:hypothetical protein